MKYQEIEPFKKHLKASFPNNLSDIYLVVTSDNYERLRIIDSITCFFPKSNAFSQLRFSAEKTAIKEVIINLDSPFFLGGRSIVIVDELDFFKRKDILDLVTYIKKGCLNCFLVLGAKEKKSILTLLSEVDKRGVVLDLSSEKPWEKQKRLMNFIVEKCAQAKKSISSEAKETLISFIGNDLSAIEKEIEKVIIYVGEKSILEKEDVVAICNNLNTVTFWQIAETIIWGTDPFCVNLEKDYTVESTFFYSLVSALRYNLQEGLKLASAWENNLNLSSLFPMVRPKVLQIRQAVVSKFGPSFFKKMLQLLFEIELLSKQGNISFLALLDYFRVKLAYYKGYEKQHDYSLTQSSF